MRTLYSLRHRAMTDWGHTYRTVRRTATSTGVRRVRGDLTVYRERKTDTTYTIHRRTQPGKLRAVPGARPCAVAPCTSNPRTMPESRTECAIVGSTRRGVAPRSSFPAHPWLAVDAPPCTSASDAATYRRRPHLFARALETLPFGEAMKPRARPSPRLVPQQLAPQLAPQQLQLATQWQLPQKLLQLPQLPQQRAPPQRAPPPAPAPAVEAVGAPAAVAAVAPRARMRVAPEMATRRSRSLQLMGGGAEAAAA